MQNNDKIQGFFSEQLRELKATYSNKIWGNCYEKKNDTRTGLD